MTKKSPARKAPSVRLLPAIIAVGLPLLVLRVGEVAVGIDGLTDDVIGAPVALAADPPEDVGDVVEAPTEVATAQEAPAPAPLFAQQTARLTDSEIEILQQLSSRREALDARERKLDQREALLIATEAQIDQKFEELNGLRAEIELLLDQKSEEEEAQINSLVRIYETMKPKDAARIFDDLEMPILLQVVGRMKELRSAPIIASMEPRRARELTTALMVEGRLPQDPMAK